MSLAPRAALFLIALLALPCSAFAADEIPTKAPVSFSGRYPHLTMFNKAGECGIGAVVTWDDRLWVVTYSPHEPKGSDDKLYEINNNLVMKARPESVGGTPANRMIHRESNQLIIGPHFIDDKGNVRTVPPSKMPGRLTAVARHLTDPANKVYVYDMEGAVYEVDVHSLDVKRLFVKPVPGWHGKGAYTAQGLFVVANNGDKAVSTFKESPYKAGADPKNLDEAGVLASWDGKDWKIVERKQFTEVTGPDGIYGGKDKDSPLWAVGWDKRSLILKLLDGGKWHTFRLPKGDYSYDARHGWYTEWPRIREVMPAQTVNKAKLLMNMHGTFFNFPEGFSAANTSGIAPLSTYAKITGDYCCYKGMIVVACDDASKLENPLLGQSQSNLWFTNWKQFGQLGPRIGFGGPWVNDDVKAGVPSDPFLLNGYDRRVLHLSHATDKAVNFNLEIDINGDGKWTPVTKIEVPAKGYAWRVLPADLSAQWIRITPDSDATKATAYFHLTPDYEATKKRLAREGDPSDPKMFDSLAGIDDEGPRNTGLVRPRGENLGTLQLAAVNVSAEGKTSKPAHYTGDINAELSANGTSDEETKALEFLLEKGQPALNYSHDDASIIFGSGKTRYRLPKTSAGYDATWAEGRPRAIRELATERSMLNAGGTFYILPRESSGGVAAIKPVATHGKRIYDFCSWRGLMVLTGTKANAKPDRHYVAAKDGQAGVWLGDIDDLWKFGKPVGTGGPWKNTAVKAGAPSDPYLMTGYDQKSVELSHDGQEEVEFTLEIDFLRDGNWHAYKQIAVPAGKSISHEFPAGFSAHWVRVTANKAAKATVLFTYK